MESWEVFLLFVSFNPKAYGWVEWNEIARKPSYPNVRYTQDLYGAPIWIKSSTSGDIWEKCRQGPCGSKRWSQDQMKI